jgi:hypothetical protein
VGRCKITVTDQKLYRRILSYIFISLIQNWEEQRLRVFENRVIRRSSGPKRDEVTREWRKLPNEELHILYSSPNIIRQIKLGRMRWAGHVARMGELRKVCKTLVGKPEGKRSLGRPKHRWEDEIRMDVRAIGRWGV